MDAMKKSSPFYVIFTAVAALSLFTSSCVAQLPRHKQLTKRAGLVSLLVVGDWGRGGKYSQKLVAFQMGEVGEKQKSDIVISTGDNFYKNGLIGSKDPAFDESYTKIYTAKSLQIPWYIILGNRDYRGDIEAQLNLHRRDSRWICHRSYIVEAASAEFFFVDTTPFVDKYFKEDSDRTYKYDWRGVEPRQKYLSDLRKDLRLALRRSKSKWKIAVGHHTIRSAGETGTTLELEREILPILEESEIDLYINGHDHCLQYVLDTESGIHFITSGAGARASKKRKPLRSEHELKYFHDGEGFVSMQITASKIEFVFYDAHGHNSKTFSILKRDASTSNTT